MSETEIGIAAIVLMILLIQMGMHVAIVLMGLSFVAVWMIKENINVAGSLIAKSAETAIASYNFGVIPLFVVMGLLVSVTGIGRDTFDVAGQAFRHVRGGLGMATVAANAIFAAINGTTIASASVFTKLAVPELMRLGYTPRFSVGVVAGSSVLGMLIPPSLLLIVFGIIAEVSIGALFTAGIVPGLLLAFAYVLTIRGLVHFFPKFVTKDGLLDGADRELFSAVEMLSKMFPVALLILIVLGGIYGGVFTPVEAGGVGALGALLIAIAKRRITLPMMWSVLVETGVVTAAISFLIISAHMYANMLALSRLPNVLGNWIDAANLGLTTLLILYLVLLVLLGTILDAVSIMLITLPLVMPVMIAANVDMVWFGIITIIAVEIGLLTPPLGLAVFVIKTNLDDSRIALNDIFIGAAPFALTMLVVLALVTAIPQLALFLVYLG
jgi:tripartite ATP-independent transporter DctM subunit